MAIIDQGLFYGDRLHACSDQAHLWWAFFFLASNGFARIEVSYRKFLTTVYAGFRKPPTEKETTEMFLEFKNNYLAFLYKSDGAVWAQFYAKEGSLKKWKTKEDKATPAPPAREWMDWLGEYEKRKQSVESSLDGLLAKALPVGQRLGSDNGASQAFPLAARYVRKLFPATSESMFGRILESAIAVVPDIADEQLEEALVAAKRPNQRSAALFPETIAEVLRSWKEQQNS